MCNGLDAISSGGVSTGTGFRSVAKPDLHSAMLVVKRTNKRCWKGIDLMGAVSWFGVEKWVTRRRTFCHARQIQCIISTTSCDFMPYHFSIIFTHIKLK